jgi:hypothetical protein
MDQLLSAGIVTADGVRTLISLAALVASLISLYFTRRFWLQGNRPIVTAFVDEHSSGNMATAFDLHISNTGNRPAVDVRVEAKESDVRRLVGEGATKERIDEIRGCFGREATVALLRNGEELTTAFGSYGVTVDRRVLNYGVSIPITVRNKDLDGRTYRARMPLKIFARTGFGGSVWIKRKRESS